jgi:uncharacterized membrane protein YozB (DUF420 family)
MQDFFILLSIAFGISSLLIGYILTKRVAKKKKIVLSIVNAILAVVFLYIYLNLNGSAYRYFCYPPRCQINILIEYLSYFSFISGFSFVLGILLAYMRKI